VAALAEDMAAVASSAEVAMTVAAAMAVANSGAAVVTVAAAMAVASSGAAVVTAAAAVMEAAACGSMQMQALLYHSNSHSKNRWTASQHSLVGTRKNYRRLAERRPSWCTSARLLWQSKQIFLQSSGRQGQSRRNSLPATGMRVFGRFAIVN